MKRVSSIYLIAMTLLSNEARAEPVHPTIGLPTDPDAALLTYWPDSGDLSVTQPEESTRGMTTLEIVSQSESFVKIPCPLPTGCGLFDVWNNSKLFRLDPTGFSEIHFSGVLKTGLSIDFLANDLLVDGALVGGGSLPEVVFPIPEPDGPSLLCVATICLALRPRSIRRTEA